MTVDHHLIKVALALCEGLDTAVSHSVKSDILSGRWGDLVARQVRPGDYSDADSYLKDAIAVNFLRKCEGLPSLVDRRKRAVSNFFACEEKCRLTNRRLSRLLSQLKVGYFDSIDDLKVFELVEVGRSFVASVLRGLPETLVPKFGPGATFHDKGLKSTILHKLSSRPTRTPDFWWSDLVGFSETAWGRSVLTRDPRCSSPQVELGNRFTTVPKDSQKFRGICVEPGLNVVYQLAVGNVVKQKLKRCGVDLFEGQEKHRDLARRASLTGSHATIDLSDASDTVASSFVELMLPSGWFSLLDDLRSKSTKIDGKWVRLEKFSSMGNGFTFELETLLFLALCVMACHIAGLDGPSLVAAGEVTVYGDDIIVPTAVAPHLLTLLSFFGFTPNREKTFLEGPFRESCGGDFFQGQAVRPFYLKGVPNEPQQWVALANGLRRLGIPDSSGDTWRFGLLRPWLRALDALPGSVRRLRGPRFFGDLLIHDHHSKWCTREKEGRREVRGYVPVAGRAVRLSWFPGCVQLAAALYGVPSTGALPRDCISGFVERWLPLFEVDEFGN